MVSPCGDDFFVGATFGRPHGLYKFKPCRFQKRAVEGASPYKYSGKFVVPQNRYALCGFYVVLWDGKSGAEFFYSDTALILLLVCFSSIAFLQRFCRLAPIEALPQALTGLCPVPTSPLAPGLSVRFISRFARCFIFTFGLLCPFLIPHSSLLTPHSSFLTPHSSFLISHSSPPH